MVLPRPLRLKPTSADHLLNSKPSHNYSPVEISLQRKGSLGTFLITIIVANPVWTSAGDSL